MHSAAAGSRASGGRSSPQVGVSSSSGADSGAWRRGGSLASMLKAKKGDGSKTAQSASPNPSNKRQAAPRTPPSMRDRLLFVYMKLVGENVEVKLKNNVVIGGILCSHDPLTPPAGVVLSYAKVLGDVPAGAATPELSPKKESIIDWSIIDFIVAKGVARGEETLAQSASSRFTTDTAITGQRGRQSFQRKLVAAGSAGWLAAKDTKAPEDGADDIAAAGPDGKWDQFKANREKFGVKDTYKETFYTTELPENITPEMRKKAEEMAKSIQAAPTSNPHLAEERGHKALSDGWDDDEEARYGAVVGSGAYAKAVSAKGATPPKKSAWDRNLIKKQEEKKGAAEKEKKDELKKSKKKSSPPPGLNSAETTAASEGKRKATSQSEDSGDGKESPTAKAGPPNAWGPGGVAKKSLAEMLNGNLRSPVRVNRVPRSTVRKEKLSQPH